MGLLQKFFGIEPKPDKEEIEEEVRLESAKIKAFRAADEVAAAANLLLLKSRELKAEINRLEESK